MGQVTWEADKMLDVYIYDYLVKRNLQETAKAFMAEGKVATDPVAIDAPGGFLFEWWSVFWDIFIARTNEKHSDVAAAYFETQQMKAKEQLKMQQYQLMQRQAAMLQRGDANRAALAGGASPAISGAVGGTNCDGILGSSAASSLAAKVYGEHLKNPNSVDSEAHKSQSGHPGQSVQGQPGNMASALMQMQGRNQQTMIPQDIRPGLGGPQRSLAVDPSLYRQMLAQGKSGIGSGVGVNQGAGGPATLNGWPLSSERSGPQVHKPLMSSSNPYQLLSLQQQQLLGQGHVQGNVANSLGYGEIDPQRLRALQRGGLNVKDGQPTGIEGQVGSTMQPSSAMVRQDQVEYLMKVQQSPVHRPQEQLQQQYQLQQNPRKRKPTSSGAANSSGTGNTVGPSSTPPSTPSTNTPGDEVAMGSNLSHASNMPKSSMVYGTNGTGGLGSSPNQMDDLENLGDIGELEEHLASYLTNDDDAKFFAPSKNSSAEQNVQTSKALSVIGCNRTSNNKVLCCHFSSDGKLLASAGHEKKVLIWSMGNLQTVGLREEHALMITDIRFKPESTQLATSSFDKTVRLWNADEPSSSLHTFSGHSSQVTSLDFHPKKTDILCSCDDNGEIRLWDISERSGSFFSKGGLRQVRFQERIGQFLAAASDNVVSVFDFETKRKIRVLQGHSKEVQSICWNPSGEYLASVSHDVVKVWSFPSGECIHELRSNGSNFQSCVFHLASPGILVIGGYQSLQVWDMLAKKTITESAAHDGLITALATSAAGAIASASHDKTTRLWKLVGQI